MIDNLKKKDEKNSMVNGYFLNLVLYGLGILGKLYLKTHLSLIWKHKKEKKKVIVVPI